VQNLAHCSRNPRVFAEDFAAKLPTAPQFTVCALHLQNLEDLRHPKASTSSAQTQWV
jgi:hypothetical protein